MSGVTCQVYSCIVFYGDSCLEWILVAACTFVTTELNTWHSLFLLLSKVEAWGNPFNNFYTEPFAVASANYNSDWWGWLAIHLLFCHKFVSQHESYHFDIVTEGLTI